MDCGIFGVLMVTGRRLGKGDELVEGGGKFDYFDMADLSLDYWRHFSIIRRN